MRLSLTGILVSLALTSPALAQPADQADRVSLRFARVGASDVEKVAAFYKSAFLMHEVMRIERPGFQEIFLNFGLSVEQAKAASTPQIIIMSQATGAADPPVSNIIFAVSNLSAVLARIVPAGGVVEGAPRKSPTTGSTSHLVRDPGGNRIELIMPAALVTR